MCPALTLFVFAEDSFEKDLSILLNIVARHNQIRVIGRISGVVASYDDFVVDFEGA
jgi:hypothetical protein